MEGRKEGQLLWGGFSSASASFLPSRSEVSRLHGPHCDALLPLGPRNKSANQTTEMMSQNMSHGDRKLK